MSEVRSFLPFPMIYAKLPALRALVKNKIPYIQTRFWYFYIKKCAYFKPALKILIAELSESVEN
jgi:hypothetical protein